MIYSVHTSLTTTLHSDSYVNMQEGSTVFSKSLLEGEVNCDDLDAILIPGPSGLNSPDKEKMKKVNWLKR